MRYRFYYYLCQKCDKEFDILKASIERDKQETCPNCSNPIWKEDLIEKAHDTFKAKNYANLNTKVEDAEYNPGLGCVTRNKNHRSELANRQGLQEVGNDYNNGESMQNNFDRQRQEKLDRRYD